GLLTLVCWLAAIGALVSARSALAAASARPPVYVFPVPGGHVASPRSQIVFRGVPITNIGTVTVFGSESGAHVGTLRGDSDGRGASLLPATAFTPGETVTVATSLNVVGGSRGSFRFTVASPATGIQYKPAHAAPRVRDA